MFKCETAVAVALAAVLAGCSLVNKTADEAPLRSEYAKKTASVTQANLYNKTVLITAGAGAVTHVVPGLHLLGLVADTGVVLYYFDELIYGTGAIVAREQHCPALLEKADYWNVLGAGLSNIKSSAEFDTILGLAPAITPFVSSDKAAELFISAIQTHGPQFVGTKLTALVMAKLTAKGLAGLVPVVGIGVAAGINWYIFHRLNDAATAYYQAKAEHVCGAKPPTTPAPPAASEPASVPVEPAAPKGSVPQGGISI